MTHDETVEFRRELEHMKEKSKFNKLEDIIDFDLFSNKLLNKLRLLVNRAKIYVNNAF